MNHRHTHIITFLEKKIERNELQAHSIYFIRPSKSAMTIIYLELSK